MAVAHERIGISAYDTPVGISRCPWHPWGLCSRQGGGAHGLQVDPVPAGDDDSGFRSGSVPFPFGEQELSAAFTKGERS